jgi:peptidoglycan/xylan/chitin deacetylase (PgdA/CDA1 family)
MVKIPKLIKAFFSSVLWKGNESEKVIYLTFDDGPTPEVTPKVLSLLKEYNASATFFCLGNKVELYKDVYSQIIEQEHSVGNHSYSHYLVWRTASQLYFKDVDRASKLIDSKLFRPPYGKMKLSQYRYLKKDYNIVLWDVIPGDYKKSMTVLKLVNNVVDNVSNGSIVVLHDSEKCAEVMLVALPVILEKLSEKGYVFKSIVDEK